MAQTRGLLVGNIDFPKNYIRQALIAGGFSIEEAEFDTCRGTSHAIIWLQSNTKYKIARDSFLAYQVENHNKLFVKPAPEDAIPAPKRQLNENEHPKIYRVRGNLRKLIRDNDSLKARQAAAASPSVAASSMRATPITDQEQQPTTEQEKQPPTEPERQPPTEPERQPPAEPEQQPPAEPEQQPPAEPEQQSIIPEEEDATVVVQVERSPRMMEPDQGRKRFRSIWQHETEEVEEIEDSQEEESLLHKRQRA
ncbi:MAG: hypothetical protein Q9195_009605 [Heterodermia aff. obscurata]